MLKSGSSIVLPAVYFDHIIEWNHIGYISTHLLFSIKCLNRFGSIILGILDVYDYDY